GPLPPAPDLECFLWIVGQVAGMVGAQPLPELPAERSVVGRVVEVHRRRSLRCPASPDSRSTGSISARNRTIPRIDLAIPVRADSFASPSISITNRSRPR